jgi:hypothetical protein
MGRIFQALVEFAEGRNDFIGITLQKLTYECVWVQGRDAMSGENVGREITQVHCHDDACAAVDRCGQHVAIVAVG